MDFDPVGHECDGFDIPVAKRIGRRPQSCKSRLLGCKARLGDNGRARTEANCRTTGLMSAVMIRISLMATGTQSAALDPGTRTDATVGAERQATLPIPILATTALSLRRTK